MTRRFILVLIALVSIPAIILIGAINHTYQAEVEILFTYPGIGRANDDDPIDRIIELINLFRGDNIFVSAYTITSESLANALAAQARIPDGRIVEVLIERANACEQGSKIDVLLDAGVQVYVDNAAGLMNNNVIVLYDHDGPPHLVITGSYNFSVASEERNFENVVIMNSWAAMQEYADAADIAIQMASPFEGCPPNS